MLDGVIVELDEEEDALLQQKLRLLAPRADTLRIPLGVWLAKGSMGWFDIQNTAWQLDIPIPNRAKQEPYLPLLHWMISYRLQKEGAEDTVYLWKAQQAYRIMQLLFSAKEQEIILSKL